MKRRTISGDEVDITSRWRYITCKGWVRHNSARVKRKIRRRERHEGKREIEDQR